MLCGGTNQLVAAHDNELYRDYVLGFREGVNNVTKCLQHYISNFQKCTHGKTHSSLSICPRCVLVCVLVPHDGSH